MTPEEVRLKCIECTLHLLEINRDCVSYFTVINIAKDLEEYVWTGTVPEIKED